jgi:hypothetical protein
LFDARLCGRAAGGGGSAHAGKRKRPESGDSGQNGIAAAVVAYGASSMLRAFLIVRVMAR